jgi:hypothetical protein
VRRLFIKAAFHQNSFSSKQLFIEMAFHPTITKVAHSSYKQMCRVDELAMAIHFLAY